MSFITSIKSNFLKRKTVPVKNRQIILKRPQEFHKVLILVNKINPEIINRASGIFPNAEINFLYERKTKEDNSEQFEFSVHPSDFNLTGQLKNDKLKKLLRFEFDLILDLCDESVFMNFLFHNLNSTLSIGVMKEELNEKYDLFFDEKRPIEFLEQTKKQLNQLIPHGSN